MYSVPLRVSPSLQCTILINLPPMASPNSPPVMFCDPIIPKHSMISNDGLVKLPDGMGIDGDLVSILSRIIQLNQSQSQTDDYNRYNGDHNLSGTDYGVDSYDSTHPDPEEDKFDLSLVDSLSEDQIKNLLKDEAKFFKFLSNFKNIQSERQLLIEEMREKSLQTAQDNLNIKKEIGSLSLKLDETHRKYTETCQSFQNFVVLNSSTLSALKPENILTEIQVNLMELNDSSNNFIENALKSEENLDSVLKECVKLRREYHSKSILLQKSDQ